jgi:IS4 transposase
MERLGLDDPRVEARGVQLFERIVSTGSLVLRTLGETRAGEVAAQRWLSSPRVSVERILAAASVRTVRACEGRRVLVSQDTSEINFERWMRRQGLGPGGNGKTPAFFVHPLVAVDVESEAVLGLVGAQIWTRGPEPARSRHARAVEAKESRRWIEGAACAAERLEGAAQVVVACDQEGDLWAHFVRRPAGAELLVRARHDRQLDDGGALFGAPANWPELARWPITIAARKIGEKPRQAMIAVRAGAVLIRRPESSSEGPPQLVLSFVEAREIDPPPGAEPVLWRLLTSLPVEDAAQALEVVRLYRLRWRIEEVFRTLKSDGLKLEESQVQQAEHLFRLAALALAAATRILQLVDARDGGSRPMSDVLDQALEAAVAVIGKTREGATERQKNPHPQGSLAWVSWIVARYGGWNAYYKPPGPKTMAQGWERFSAVLTGYLIANEALP